MGWISLGRSAAGVGGGQAQPVGGGGSGLTVDDIAEIASKGQNLWITRLPETGAAPVL